MTTYLLTWNPHRWHWADLQANIEQVRQHGAYEDEWSCGGNKSITIGDRVFLLRQGIEPRGIVASGWAISNVFEDEHWDADKRALGQPARRIGVRFDVILDADQEPIYPRDLLDQPNFQGMHWNTQMSGITIPDGVADALEIAWARFLAGRSIVQLHTAQETSILPEEAEATHTYIEGATTQITVNAYERNPQARKKCLEHYGLDCSVCGFNFEQIYGDVGVGFIHVHHLKQLSEIKAAYKLNPIQDLRPVCPNCHAMIHRRKPAYTIEEARQFLRS